MASYRTSRILPIILVVLVIIIAIAAIVSLARVVFFSGTSNSSTTQVDTSRTALLDTTAGHSVSMAVRGPIVANESFHSYKIDISANSRTINTYTGYLKTVVATNTLGNNIPSYGEFVNALDKANLTKGKQLTGDKNDTSGVCATGDVYTFTIYNGSTDVKDLWTSTCSGSKGSLDASVTQLTSLFIKQIPGADKLISNISLNN